MNKLSVIIPHRYMESRSANYDFVLSWYKDLFPEAEFISADDPNPKFNRGRALDAGVKQSSGDVLIFGDGDLLVSPKSLHMALKEIQDTDVGFVVPFTRVAYLNEPSSKKVIKCGVLKENYPGTTFWKQPSTGGINVLKRSSYEASFGFDPRFEGWGFEDSAFDAAMQCLVGPTRWLEGPSYHLHHPSYRNGSSADHKAGIALCDRYRQAIKNKEAMLEIIGERK